jgi:hypothetical protein
LIDAFNLPEHLKRTLPNLNVIPISFESPTPPGKIYIGRNHKLVEQLGQLIMALAFEPKPGWRKVARASVIQTEIVDKRTVIVQFRVRNVIREVGRSKEIIAEEMYLWGFQGTDENRTILNYNSCKTLLLNAVSSRNIAHERQIQLFSEITEKFGMLHDEVQKLTEERAEHLVEAHGRFKDLVDGRKHEAVYPVLPPDVMGVYILLPVPKSV